MRDAHDLHAFEHQLDRIVAGGADHLVLSGDLLDRWRPRLLARALDALDSRRLLEAGRCTIVHGNHHLTPRGAPPPPHTPPGPGAAPPGGRAGTAPAPCGAGGTPRRGCWRGAAASTRR